MGRRDYLVDLRSLLAAREPILRTRREFHHGAVIVPLVEEDGEVKLLFELRAPNLSRHAGLVSFPGGVIEEGEEPLAAALREMHEEVGIPPQQVETYGALDTVEAISGDRIYPFVCRVLPGYRVTRREMEVEAVFTVPLEFLLTHGLREAQMIQELHPSADFPAHLLPPGSLSSRYSRPVLYLVYDRFLIWGLTARIVQQLLELLQPPPGR